MGMTKSGAGRVVAIVTAIAGLGVSAPSALAAGSATGTAAGTIARVGSAPAAKRIALGLPLRTDSAGLARFATAVSTPGSPQYGRYESVAALSRRFGAPAAERRKVVAYLRHAGATGVTIDVTGLFADATMRVDSAQRLFGTRLAAFHAPATPTAAAARFVAPTGTARVPAGLDGAVTGVVGLDTRPLAAAPLQRASATKVASTATRAASTATRAGSTANTSAYPTRTGTPAGCPSALAKPGFTPNQYLAAYGYVPLHLEGLQGQGERVALIEIDGFKTSDVTAFAHCFKLRVPHLNAFGVGIKKALAPGGESTLDLELLTAAAPRLKAVDVYESHPMAAEVLRSLTAPLANKGRKPDVISASLGSCEPATQAAIGNAGIRTVESTLQLAAASGISVLASSGDDGSTSCVSGANKPLNLLSVNYPAASPWVTGVGGTNIKLNVDNAIADPATDQIVWNDEPALLGAGGGGLSTFKRPAYQNGFVAAPRREVPDVSMLADPLPGYEIYCTARSVCRKSTRDSPWANFGGTSAGTPLLAGGLALADQALRSRGQQDIGFANPLLYRIDRSATATATISDVVQGSNDISATVFGKALGCCTASPGYDQASGLGSVNLTGLTAAAEALVPKRVTVGLAVPRQRRPVAAGHLLATVSCSGPCLMGAYARIRIGRSKHVLTRYSRPYALTRRRSRTIEIRLSSGTVRQLRTALRRHERITATEYGAIIDPSGHIDRHTAGRTLRVRG